MIASVLGWCLISNAAAPVAAPPDAAAANVMALEYTYPELSLGLKLIRINMPDLAAFLSDPTTVCTLFAASYEATLLNLKRLGKYAGLMAQNTTLMNSVVNYPMVPGMALTADQIGRNITRAMTRANETIYFWRNKGKPYVYAWPAFLSALNKTNIKAGKCIVHTIDVPLAPPTARSQFQAWMEDLGTMPPMPPKAQWAPIQEPLPGSLEAGGTKAAAELPKASAKSSSGSWKSNSLLSCGSALLAVALAAALVL